MNSEAHGRERQTFTHWIGGERLDGARHLDVTNPASVARPHRRRPGGATFKMAIALINAHPYGNGTWVFTRGGEAARRFSEAIELGMVGITVPVPVAFHSFGGW